MSVRIPRLRLTSASLSLAALLLVFGAEILVKVVHSDGLLLLYNRAERIPQGLR